MNSQVIVKQYYSNCYNGCFSLNYLKFKYKYFKNKSQTHNID